MDAYYSYLNHLLSKNKKEYAAYPDLNWLNPYAAQDFQEIRNELLNTPGQTTLFKQTKPYYKQLSDGCRICGAGLWSCLFITGKCNANCFYCPTSQNADELPSSQGLTFPTPESYAEYIKHFGFKGVSFSGGEPLLYAQRVYDYLEAVRKFAPDDIYTWMYTNGILASPEVFQKLASQNLNEVRFDIGAINYNLDKIKMAKGLIKNLTVEIPAVPEEKERLIKLLPQMIDAGVSNLNLHQLRLTPYNVEKFKNRPYTYIPAEKPLVLESELAALEIMHYADKQQLPIGVNYCSFFFKNRFQSAGFRKQISKLLFPEQPTLSQRGYIRKQNPDGIEYHIARLTDENNPSKNAQLLSLNHKKYAFGSERLTKIEFSNEFITSAAQELLANEPEQIPEDSSLFEVWKHEWIEPGLRNY
ncbi:MAG: radical SAM protein [Bacteroidetes bacterium HGW-Bacteroidetes-4]|jgi:hypothetical protein|nr:MAG: radical SAM protein [Bacteroidetes bacterium HGW-Bacteroidetes-4]